MEETPPPPYRKDSIPTHFDDIIALQPVSTTPPSATPLPSAIELETGTYSIVTICDNCGLIIANIPKCIGEGVCLSWTEEGCCGTEGSCDPEDACAICCAACSNMATTFGLVLRDLLTCYPWKGVRKFVLAALVLIFLVWIVGRGRMW